MLNSTSVRVSLFVPQLRACKSRLFTAAFHCLLWLVWLYLISPHSRMNGTVFEKIFVEGYIFYLIPSTTFVRHISHSLKNRTKYSHEHSFSYKLPRFLHILITFEFVRQISEKSSNTKFHKNSVQLEPRISMRTGRQTRRS